MSDKCPLCGGNNACAVNRDAEASHCWCFSARIPRELLERIPAEKRGRSCVCKACVDAFRMEIETVGK